jgi:hypothetical protein
VLNESMKDEVKITVIATGFQRENLPLLSGRRTEIIETAMPMPAPPPPASVMEPVLTNDSLFRDMNPPPPPMPEMKEPPPAPMDDLEVPAFMRRERRLYQ